MGWRGACWRCPQVRPPPPPGIQTRPKCTTAGHSGPTPESPPESMLKQGMGKKTSSSSPSFSSSPGRIDSHSAENGPPVVASCSSSHSPPAKVIITAAVSTKDVKKHCGLKSLQPIIRLLSTTVLPYTLKTQCCSSDLPWKSKLAILQPRSLAGNWRLISFTESLSWTASASSVVKSSQSSSKRSHEILGRVAHRPRWSDCGNWQMCVRSLEAQLVQVSRGPTAGSAF